MAGAKSQKITTTTRKSTTHKTSSQLTSKKKALKPKPTVQTSTPSTASACSRWASVEDEEDKEPRYVGSALSVDEDTIMEEADDSVIELSDKEPEDMSVDDEETELSKFNTSVCGCE